MKPKILALTILVFYGCWSVQECDGQSRISTYEGLETDGTILALEEDPSSNTLYVGGDFSRIGKRVSYGGIVDTQFGDLTQTILPPNDDIKIVRPDGNGGFFIAGDFTMIGPITRNKLAHISSSGGLSSWNPALQSGDEIRAMEVADGVVYIGGNFSAVGGLTRTNIAAIDATTGVPTAWNPQGFTATVEKLAIGPDDVFVASALNVKKYDIVDATLGDWDVTTDKSINDMAVSSVRLYLGGRFTEINGVSKEYVGIVNTETNAVFNWGASISSSQPAFTAVTSLAVTPGRVYIAGFFNSVDGETRQNLASLSALTSALQPLNVIAGQSPSQMIIDGDFLYQNFFTGVLKIDLNTESRIDEFKPSPIIGVHSFAIDGSSLFIAGSNRTRLGGARRENFAAVNLTNGSVTSLQLDTDERVTDLLLNGDDIYVSGLFSNIGGQTRNRFAAISRSTNTVTSFNPNFSATVSDMLVLNDILYVGGQFRTVGGIQRLSLAAIDLNTETLTDLRYAISNPVNALEAIGDTLVIGGSFTSIEYINRNRLAAINLTNGEVLPWNPDVSSGEVLTLTKSDHQTIYAGGNFGQIQAVNRIGVAELALTSNVPTAWDANLNPVTVEDIAVSKGGLVYLAGSGNFRSVGGATVNSFAVFRGDNAAPVSYDLKVERSFNTVYDVELGEDEVYAGGDFIVALPPSTNTSLAITTRANDIPFTFTLDNNSISEDAGNGTTVGKFSVTDDPGDTHTYALVNGEGDDHNNLFTVSDDKLQVNAALDFETQPTLSVRVEVADNNDNKLQQVFSINVTNVIETGSDILTASITEQTIRTSVNSGDFTVTINIRPEDDKTALAPEFTVSSGATISPSSGTIRDFSSPQTYTVKAEDGSAQTWTVAVTSLFVNETVAIGPTGRFPNLQQAFDAIIDNGIVGNVDLALEDGFTDPGFHAVTGWDGDDSFSVTIKPEAGASSVKIEADDNDGIARFTGVSNINIEGNGVLEISSLSSFSAPIMIFGNTILDIPSSNFHISNVHFTSASGRIVEARSSENITISSCRYNLKNSRVIQDFAVFRGLGVENFTIENNEIILDETFSTNRSTSIFSISNANSNTRIYNNLVKINPTTAASLRIYSESGGLFAHNTVILRGAGFVDEITLVRLNNINPRPTKVHNNVFYVDLMYNIGSGLAYGNPISPNLALSGNLIYFNTAKEGNRTKHIGNPLEGFGPGDEGTFDHIATFTSFEKPDFVDFDELRLAPATAASIDTRGISVAEVMTDRDGNNRSSTSPSKGAYEYANDIAEVLGFTFVGIRGEATIDHENGTITATAQIGTDLSAISPDITTFPGSSVNPASGVAQDFTNSVNYTVTAEAGSMQMYSVSIELREEVIWDGNAWSNGTGPGPMDDIVIDGTYNSSTDGNLTVNRLTVNAGGNVVLGDGDFIEINGDLINNGTDFLVKSGGSLVTHGTVTGSNFTFLRTTTFNQNTGRYSIVGSPVQNASFSALGSSAIIYGYDESEAYNILGNEGADRFKTPIQLGHSNMQTGVGYFSAKTGDANGEVNFQGTPHFGSQTINLSLTDHPSNENAFEGFNLMANPYPAAIDYAEFINANSDDIESAIYLWDDFNSEDNRGTN
ncbi:MAG: hypothetical protein AAFO69_03710, partial [Bacteroidota bacterium]